MLVSKHNRPNRIVHASLWKKFLWITKSGVIFLFVSKSTQLFDTLFICYSWSISNQEEKSTIVVTNLWGHEEGWRWKWVHNVNTVYGHCVHAHMPDNDVSLWHQMVQKPLWDVVPDLNKVMTLFKVNSWFARRRRCLSISFHRCSMGDKSGETAG